MKVRANPVKRFNNPINVGGVKVVNPVESKSVDEQTDSYLSERRRRKLEEAKEAELDLAAEQSRTETARQRKERELIESGQVSPIRGEEAAMENVNERVMEAAEVAAEAAVAGASPEQARDLATGKQRVVILQPRTGQGARTEEEAQREKVERIEQAKALYVSCIDAGGDPKRCADMVAGLIPSSPGVSAPPATSVTELIDALVKLDGLRGANAGMAELKASFDNLAAEMRRGGSNQQVPLDPVAFAEQQAKALVAWRKAIQEVIPQPEARGDGKNLEVVKEENRHSEKMEEIKVDRDYKGDLTAIAGDIPERIGQGLADHWGKGGGGGSGAGAGAGGGARLESLICTEKGCGAKIYLTPETGEQVTCPKCGMIYQKRQTVESNTE